MEIEEIVHKNVSKDGTFSDGQRGAVITDGDLRIDMVGGYVSIVHPINSFGEVHVSRVSFGSSEELEKFLNRNHFYYK